VDRIDRAALVFVGGCAAAMGIAPPPPPVPLVRKGDRAVMDASVRAAAERARAWTRDHGDHVLPWEEADGHMAIVIDDVGRELHVFEALVSLRHRLTFNVLPGAPYTRGVQQRLLLDDRRPREVWLHLPMEPMRGELMTAGSEAQEVFLRVEDSPAVLRRKVAQALVAVPLAVGVGHHMGSRFTADRPALCAALAPICARGLAYLDARTTAASQAEGVAGTLGCPRVGRRHVFLDAQPGEAAIERALWSAAEASRKAPVVAIGHPTPALARVLARAEDELVRRRIGVYPLSELLSHLEPPEPTSPAQGGCPGPNKAF